MPSVRAAVVIVEILQRKLYQHWCFPRFNTADDIPPIAGMSLVSDAADHLDQARDDLLAFTAFLHEIWKQIYTTNASCRPRRSADAPTSSGSSLPNRAAVIRLVGAVLAEQTDKWTYRHGGQDPARTEPESPAAVCSCTTPLAVTRT
jgi:Transposase, Mutator family